MSWVGKPKWLLLMAALAGCQEPELPTSVAAPAVTATKPTVASDASSVTKVADGATAPKAAKLPLENPAPVASAEPPFEPPFGHRVELFVPPQQDSAPVERAPRSEESSPEVVLKGFVNVGAARAVLLIDGAVYTLGTGQEKHGIRLVSIEPPQVTLERGRRRWTLALVKSVPVQTHRTTADDEPPAEPPHDADE